MIWILSLFIIFMPVSISAPDQVDSTKMLSLSGVNYNDLNGNGFRDKDEPGLDGWIIRLMQNETKILQAVTNSSGLFYFNKLEPGYYKLVEEPKDGWIQTDPGADYYEVNLVDKNASRLDFGNHFGPIEITIRDYPLMSPEAASKEMEEYYELPQATIDPEIQAKLKAAPFLASISLLSYLPYIAAERDQGYCGNCWAWASTGCMEIDNNAQRGISNRLSIQYLNSKYNGGTGSRYACCGGSVSDFANFYASEGMAIPWSNANAHWQDGSTGCGGSTTRDWNTISTTSNHPMTSITPQVIATHGVTQETAINNIKAQLLANKPVFFGFVYPSTSTWNSFKTWWGTQSETTIWNHDIACGQSQSSGAGGHGVLCVGFNDTDSANKYWIMVNSWGTGWSNNRPNGIFRINMNMNYNCNYPGWRPAYNWYTFDIAWPPSTPPSKATLVSPSGSVSSNQPTYTWNSVPESAWYYLFIDGPSGKIFANWYTAAEATNGSTCQVTPNLTLEPGKSYTWWIQTRNSYGDGPWSDAKSFTVAIPPGKAILVSPSGTVSTRNPTYTWNKVNGSTWYYLWVNGPTRNVIKKWYQVGINVTCTSTCLVTPTKSLGKGNHTWWIQTWNSYGYGPWSDEMKFSAI